MVKGVEGVAKRTLNWMNGNRIISIQEAIFEIDELPLVICSEHIQDVFINNFFKLRRKNYLASSDAFLQYLNRKSHMNFSFSQFFYNIIAPTIRKKQKISKEIILNPLGLNGTPVHPIDYNYA